MMRKTPRSCIIERWSSNVNAEHLEEIFGKFGGVAEVTLEKDANMVKGTAYIRFHKRDEAETAQLHMHEGQIDGNRVQVNFVLVQPKPKKRSVSPKGNPNNGKNNTRRQADPRLLVEGRPTSAAAADRRRDDGSFYLLRSFRIVPNDDDVVVEVHLEGVGSVVVVGVLADDRLRSTRATGARAPCRHVGALAPLLVVAAAAVLPDIALGPVIGNGAFSTVFSATYKGQRVALKRQAYGAHILRELSILKQIDHPSLLRYIGSCEYTHQDTKEVWILSEFVGGGDVSKYLKGKKSPHLTWKETVQIALDAADGLRYMHEKGIIHRDVKAANMLLDEHLRIRLCDFGFAREVASDNNPPPPQDPSVDCGLPKRERRMSLCGTDTYMPPVNEDGFLKRQPAKNFAIDMDEFRAGVRPTCPSSLVLLAENCTAFEPTNRPTAREVVEWLEDLQKDLDINQKQQQQQQLMLRKASSVDSFYDDNESESLSSAHVDTVVDDRAGGHDDGSWISTHHHEDELHFDETSAPAYAGPLLMAHGPLRRWRQRWIVLQDSTLSIFRNLKHFQSMNDQGTPKLDATPLAGCRKPANRRWTLEHAAVGGIKWTFRASTAHELQLWVAMLTRAIHVADYLAGQELANGGSPPPPVDPTDEIYTWLDSLDLACYFQTFKSKGFATLDYLREVCARVMSMKYDNS
ncbi:hypothetical protein DYB31_000414 [Aphanomyces astaci]|uniref:TKL/LISK/LISK-DD1 protein kinase n=2 Tax=Aphanomyces astaci TaxID=112090 RepID=A0A397F5J5_APHAT|nr:hypothetical protein DYB31_000414 [Aphanomyces astaci]